MSVTASFTSNRTSDANTHEIPVCTEALFRDIFSPLANRLDLGLVIRWGTMAEITIANYPELSDQLTKLDAAVSSDETLTQALKDHTTSRLKLLREEMNIFFSRTPDGIVFIG
ncbi:hypothetical protein ACFJIW_17415 [Tahibacter sp. UC22_41]|uniref:hypothetical protein n=1 Tax=Tahibacter sp. UC22_41 TaxID=3350178 RepID=UPI0036D8B5FA